MELNVGWVESGVAVFGILASGAGTVLWFLFQGVKIDAEAAKSAADALKTDLANYKLYVAEHYVTQNDLTKAISSLERSIERLIDTVDKNSQETRDSFGALYERLDKKADK
jgi:hypothetical protein